MKAKTPQDIKQYKDNYSEPKFWKKIANVAKGAGKKTIYMALLLFYVLKSGQVSTEDKVKICGALGYFILPLDLIADAIPVLGFSDDIGALAWALHTVWKNITPEMKELAQKKTDELFA